MTVFALTACAGFKEMKQTLVNLQSLQQGLVATFNEPNTNVNVNNSTLTVTFVNSQYAKLPETTRAALGRQVAEYVRDHYADYARITEVCVGFQSSVSAGVLNASKTEVPYVYTAAELGAPPAMTAGASADTTAK